MAKEKKDQIIPEDVQAEEDAVLTTENAEVIPNESVPSEDAAITVPEAEPEQEPEPAEPEPGTQSNQKDREGAGETHAAPDDNDADKAAAMKLNTEAPDYAAEENGYLAEMPIMQTVIGAVRYLAGLKLSQSEMADFKNAFPGLF